MTDGTICTRQDRSCQGVPDAVESVVVDELKNWWEIAQEEFAEGESWEDITSRMRSTYGIKASSSVISKVRHGTRPLKTDFLEALAGSLGISPFRFGEYHLAIAREMIDEHHVGLEEALNNLDRLPELVTEASEQSDAVPILEETGRQIDQALSPAAGSAAQGSAKRAARRGKGRA